MSATAQLEKTLPTEALFGRYHTGWETKDPELIASLHSGDTVFQLHDGSLPVVGRDALREHCRALFDTYDFSQLMGRRIYGRDYWIFDWTMVLSLALPDDSRFVAHVDMVDVVKVDADGLVISKHVYPDAQQMTDAFAKAGIAR